MRFFKSFSFSQRNKQGAVNKILVNNQKPLVTQAQFLLVQCDLVATCVARVAPQVRNSSASC